MPQRLKKLLMLLIFLAAPAATLAGTPVTGPRSLPFGTAVFSPSTNVTVYVSSDSGNYAAGAFHVSGRRVFGTSSADNRIYYKTSNTGSLPTLSDLTATITGPTTTFDAVWPAM
jgi:hypothetical protein